jgi:predicted nucleic acid-binding protein
MKVLVDTSVWIHHFRHGEPALAGLLRAGVVRVHPAVIGELACGTMRHRARVLDDLRRLPGEREVPLDEVLGLVDGQRLWGRGLGWTDVQLLAATKVGGAGLWTLDRALAEAAKRLGVSWEAP